MPETPRPLRLGISACLLGRKVRYDGGHKLDGFLAETLGQYVDWVPVCPEVEVGLGTPRPPIRLAGPPDDIRLEVIATGEELTDRMSRFADARTKQLAAQELDGFVLKKDSPSCGMVRVKLYEGKGAPSRQGVGLFARALMQRLPLLPVEEEGRLHDPALRENFIERVFAYRRLRALRRSKPKPRDLVEFHTQHKLALSAHSPELYRRLGRLVAQAGARPMSGLLDDYAALYMEALRTLATRKKHADVLFHLLGHLKRALDSDDRAELVETIDSYREGLVPLVVPLTLLRHHFRRHPSDWVLAQTYLEPYPAELMLRNHV